MEEEVELQQPVNRNNGKDFLQFFFGKELVCSVIL
jgi:hypothetical protein